MADWDPLFSGGSAAVNTGGTSVTIAGTTLLASAGIRAGDQFKAQGLLATVTTAPSNNTALAIKPWPGSNLAAAVGNYEVMRISDSDRLIAANASLMQILVPNLSAFGGLVGAANKSPYFTGVGAMALHDLTTQGRALLDDTTFDMMLATLGGGTRGISAFKGVTRGQFLVGSGVTNYTGVIANNGFVTLDVNSASEAYFVFVAAHTTGWGGIALVRNNATAGGVVVLARSGSSVNGYATPLSGSTGAASSINLGVDNANPALLYLENRIGTAVPLQVHILKFNW